MCNLEFRFYWNKGRCDYDLNDGFNVLSGRARKQAISQMHGSSFQEKWMAFKALEDAAFIQWAENNGISIKAHLLPESLVAPLKKHGHSILAIQNMTSEQILDEAMTILGCFHIWKQVKAWDQSLRSVEHKLTHERRGPAWLSMFDEANEEIPA